MAETAPAPALEVKPQPVSAPPAVVERTSSPGVVVTPPPVSPTPSAQAQPLKPNIIKTTVSRPGVQTNSEAGAVSQRSAQTNKDLDDDDDDDQPAGQNQSPLQVYVRPNSAVAARGQDLYVAVFVNGALIPSRSDLTRVLQAQDKVMVIQALTGG